MNIVTGFNWMYTAATFDFFISELDCYHNPEISKIVEQVVIELGKIFPFCKVCFVCDRPTKLSLDTENRLQSEDEPAIEFADNFSLYANHSTISNFKILQP